ncbi:Myb-like DNA-binding domain protein [Ceratocystis platani]|uniref:Myb-like DNA-binding domain protein n=1 Tax=Ceratocystis fimbriata f. sp. platani TaxID=88771 RepID=A0A0F8BJ30_CERFI|nr:Myb-like DNA-binding domain protein [Ceratocystis platani]
MPYAQPPPAFAPAGPPPPHMLQHPHNAHPPHSRYTGGSGSAGAPPVHHQVMTAKRGMPPHTSESPAKKQSKWSHEEDALIIELRGGGMKWEDISKRLPGRSAISCRLHYQNYLERRSEWDEERKNKLARLYERPYSTPAYSIGGGGSTSNASPVSKPDLSPPGQSQLPSMAGYPPTSEAQAPPVYETTGSKRRASPDLMPRDSRRRYYEHPDDAARRRMA